MAQDVTQVRAGITGALYVAPVGTTDPSNTGSSWPAGWVDIGIVDKDNAVSIEPKMTTKDIYGWQQFFPVRTLVTERGMEWTFALIQKSGTNLKLAYGGGTITSLGGGDYEYDPPAPATIDYRAFGLEVSDGSIIDRYVLERGVVTKVAKIPFKRDEAVKFDLTVGALAAPGSSTQPWKLISNDPAMAS